MKQILAIAAGGAAGALLRYWASTAVYGVMGRGFPYGTLVVNISGCLLMGALYALLVERLNLGVEWRAALLIGVLGAYTTFSSFSMETVALIEEGALAKALLNIFFSVTLCIAATWLGLVAGRRI